MKLVALSPSFLLALSQFSEFAKRASWDWVKPTSAAPLGGTGVPFPEENASISHTVWYGTQSQEGLGGNKAGCGKSQLFPLVCCDLASTTEHFLIHSLERSGEHPRQIEQNSCFLLNC